MRRGTGSGGGSGGARGDARGGASGGGSRAGRVTGPAAHTLGPVALVSRLRALRTDARGPRDSTIVGEIEQVTRALQAQERALGGLGRAWTMQVPEELSRVTVAQRVHAGVLTVVARDASARYDAEMWLAEGGLARIRAASPKTLRRIKIVVGDDLAARAEGGAPR